MTRHRSVFLCLLAAAAAACLAGCASPPRGRGGDRVGGSARDDDFGRAVERAESFVAAIDRNDPEAVYSFLSSDLKARIDRDGFVRNFEDDRRYPYLSPLYLYIDGLVLTDEGGGSLSCTFAARFRGQRMVFGVVREGGTYCFSGFDDIVSGSYRDKFSKVLKWD